jgi:uncharacterized NAD(P)/FAD-binding protein YdhS
MTPAPGDVSTIAIVGGGVAGALLAIHLLTASRTVRVRLIERGAAVGRGLAYGACAPHHLNNARTSRMDTRLPVSFATWLEAQGAAQDFAPRARFGDYIEDCLQDAILRAGGRLRIIRGEAIDVATAPSRCVALADGRRIAADVVALATGHAAPAPLLIPGPADGLIANDPWAREAFADLAPTAPVLIAGTGLSMVDAIMTLNARGHVGDITAVSRRGLLPQTHADATPHPGLNLTAAGRTPLRALRHVRRIVRHAESAGLAWQGVLDAARSQAQAVWSRWSDAHKRQFMRHLAPFWNTHRHRAPQPIAQTLADMISDGRLRVLAGSIAHINRFGARQQALIRLRGSGQIAAMAVDRVLNCTGAARLPDGGDGLLQRLVERGLADVDALGLRTVNGALRPPHGPPSTWLYALGPLTVREYGDVTAAPEIAAQTEALARTLALRTPDFAMGAEPLGSRAQQALRCAL